MSCPYFGLISISPSRRSKYLKPLLLWYPFSGVEGGLYILYWSLIEEGEDFIEEARKSVKEVASAHFGAVNTIDGDKNDELTSNDTSIFRRDVLLHSSISLTLLRIPFCTLQICLIVKIHVAGLVCRKSSFVWLHAYPTDNDHVDAKMTRSSNDEFDIFFNTRSFSQVPAPFCSTWYVDGKCILCQPLNRRSSAFFFFLFKLGPHPRHVSRRLVSHHVYIYQTTNMESRNRYTLYMKNVLITTKAEGSVILLKTRGSPVALTVTAASPLKAVNLY